MTASLYICRHPASEVAIKGDFSVPPRCPLCDNVMKAVEDLPAGCVCEFCLTWLDRDEPAQNAVSSQGLLGEIRHGKWLRGPSCASVVIDEMNRDMFATLTGKCTCGGTLTTFERTVNNKDAVDYGTALRMQEWKIRGVRCSVCLKEYAIRSVRPGKMFGKK